MEDRVDSGLPWGTLPNKQSKVRVGPCECGQIFNARSDWDCVQKQKDVSAKMRWLCGHFCGDWACSLHGKYAVVIYDGDNYLILVLDRPPQELLNKWAHNRMEFYEDGAEGRL